MAVKRILSPTLKLLRIEAGLATNTIIISDRSMIRRAISNLLSNAIRHATDNTTVTITIDSNNRSTLLSVSNHGQTIPEDIQTRLFDRFFRADATRSHPGSEGAGLGLAITRAVIHAHAGSIRVESAYGMTVFTLAFPGREGALANT